MWLSRTIYEQRKAKEVPAAISTIPLPEEPSLETGFTMWRKTSDAANDVSPRFLPDGKHDLGHLAKARAQAWKALTAVEREQWEVKAQEENVRRLEDELDAAEGSVDEVQRSRYCDMQTSWMRIGG